MINNLKSKIVLAIVIISLVLALFIAFFIVQNALTTKELKNQANMLNATVVKISNELKKKGYYDNALFDGTITGSSIASDGSSCTNPMLSCEPPSAMDYLRTRSFSTQDKQAVIDELAKYNFQPLNQAAIDSFMKSQLPRVESRQKVETWFKTTAAEDEVFIQVEFSYIQDGDYYQLKIVAYNLSIFDNTDKQIWFEDRA